MKKIGTLFIVAIALSLNSLKADIVTFTSDADAFFKKYVKNGRVSYANVKKNFSEIETLYSEVNSMNLAGIDDNTKKAFYLNAYNLIVIYQVSKYYPLKSALDQSGFFDRVKHQVAGEALTLNELEIKKIILKYKDPRIHFALACAAISCPELASFAYDPEQLDNQLDKRTKMAINDNSFIQVDSKSESVKVSQIFKWYVKDFTSNGNTVLTFINKYRESEIPTNYKQGYYEYDWKLNEM